MGWERGAYSANAVSTASDRLREYKGTGEAGPQHMKTRELEKEAGRKMEQTREEEREREKTYVSNEELGTGVFEGNMTTI